MQCGKKATIAIPWAGKILKQCEEHAIQVMTIASAIGSPISPEGIETEEKCTQEIEEAI